MKNCPFCGSINEDVSRFCLECGKKLIEEPKPEQSAPGAEPAVKAAPEPAAPEAEPAVKTTPEPTAPEAEPAVKAAPVKTVIIKEVKCPICSNSQPSGGRNCSTCGASFTLDNVDPKFLEPGVLLNGKYRVSRLLRAASGTYPYATYAAWDKENGRLVKIRELFPIFAARAKGSSRVIAADTAHTTILARYVAEISAGMKQQVKEHSENYPETFNTNNTAYQVVDYSFAETADQPQRVAGAPLIPEEAVKIPLKSVTKTKTKPEKVKTRKSAVAKKKIVLTALLGLLLVLSILALVLFRDSIFGLDKKTGSSDSQPHTEEGSLINPSSNPEENNSADTDTTPVPTPTEAVASTDSNDTVDSISETPDPSDETGNNTDSDIPDSETADTETPEATAIDYDVYYYFANIGGETYTLDETFTINVIGNTSTSVKAAQFVMEIDGFTYAGAYSTDKLMSSAPEATTFDPAATFESEIELSAENSCGICLIYTRNSYEVSLNADSGISSVSGNGTYFFGEEVTVSCKPASKYSFTKWSGHFSSTEQNFTFIMPDSRVELKANSAKKTSDSSDNTNQNENKEKQTHTVTFDANGGKCSTTNITVSKGGTYGTLPKPTRTGYSFSGWYTKASGGTKVTSSSNLQTDDSHTLYAHWSLESYTITFDANGGKCSTSDKTVDYGSTYSSLPTPTRSGYTFDGWYTESSGGTKVTSSDKLQTNGNHTLYAHWSAPQFTVKFDADGGKCSTKSKTVTLGEAYGELPKPTMSGCIFEGWYTKLIGGEKVTSKTIVNLDSNITLYAHWSDAATPTPTSYIIPAP